MKKKQNDLKQINYVSSDCIMLSKMDGYLSLRQLNSQKQWLSVWICDHVNWSTTCL